MSRRGSTGTGREWDLVTSVVLLIVLVMSVGVTLLVTSFLGLSTIPCVDAGRYCNFQLIGMGTGVALWLPVGAVVIFTTWTVRRLVTGRMAYWVPLLGLVLCGVGYAVGSVLVSIGMPMPLF